jgi:hypothetical protein
MNQAGFRAAVADALAGVDQVASGDWALFAQPPDALQPPAYFLQWVDPMRTVQTMCIDTAQIEIVVVTASLEPEPNYDLGDAMIDAAHTAMVAAGLRPWQSLAPARYPMASLTYWAARIQIRQPVTVGGT